MLEAWLLGGLLLHKLVWEVLKRRYPSQAPKPGPLPLRLLKLAILGGMIAQVFLPNPFPIATEPGLIRITGGTLFTIGLALAIWARLTLGANWSDIESGAVGATHQVVNSGPYRIIRHPIYTGDFLLVSGFELALNSWLVLGTIPLVLFVRKKAVEEETTLAAALPGYAAYAQTTGRFLPDL